MIREADRPLLRLYVRTAGIILILAAIAVVATVVRNSAGAPLAEKPEGAIRIATHNVHYIVLGREAGRWSVADWERRKGPLDATFKAIAADIVAFQEMESFGGGHASEVNLALDWLLERNPGYEAAAVGDPRAFPSTQPILYRKDRFSLVDQGWYFFSETPEVLYSRTFNGSYPAFASWAVLRESDTGRDLRVVNVHFDYRSRTNRLRSAGLVAERTAPLVAEGEALVLVGDLNAWHGTRTMRTLAAAGVEFLPVRGSTYHFDRGLNLLGPIDHLALGPGLVPAGDPVVVRERFGQAWPSDHYPVVADVRLGPGGDAGL